MSTFEYLPQLMVAYDGNDKFSNLIHVKKAAKNTHYYCPCCKGIVKQRVSDNRKEQPHYYHITGKCTKENQFHFFCKHWLFEKGAKFYINENLFEVASMDIEKEWNTLFGDYKPDITVYTTSGAIIYFEMFFSNRKTEDDYFCKWDALGHDVVEVNIKEYMYKTDKNIIPTFTYLYHNGICYAKTYTKRDLYANTIAQIKRELTRQKVPGYKTRIEQLDWFWHHISNHETKESILEIIGAMEYEDMLSCYRIIKKKQCVSYLKNDVLDRINQKVLSMIRISLYLPYDENIYFDLNHIQGRTYEAGIRLKLKTEHITYNRFYSPRDHACDFEKIRGFPKITFSNHFFDIDALRIQKNEINTLRELYDNAVTYKEILLNYEKNLSVFEEDTYKIKVKNTFHTVLVKTTKDNFEVLLENYPMKDLDINTLHKAIDGKMSDNKNREFLNTLFASNEYNSFQSKLKKYKGVDIRVDINNCLNEQQSKIYFNLYINGKHEYNVKLKRNLNDFVEKAKECELFIARFMDSYSTIIKLIFRVNNSKNNFWKAQFFFDHNGYPVIEIDQKYFIPKRYLTLEKIRFGNLTILTEQDIIKYLEKGMKKVLKNMERCGYRVMEVNKS